MSTNFNVYVGPYLEIAPDATVWEHPFFPHELDNDADSVLFAPNTNESSKTQPAIWLSNVRGHGITFDGMSPSDEIFVLPSDGGKQHVDAFCVLIETTLVKLNELGIKWKLRYGAVPFWS